MRRPKVEALGILAQQPTLVDLGSINHKAETFLGRLLVLFRIGDVFKPVVNRARRDTCLFSDFSDRRVGVSHFNGKDLRIFFIALPFSPLVQLIQFACHNLQPPR